MDPSEYVDNGGIGRSSESVVFRSTGLASCGTVVIGIGEGDRSDEEEE